MTDYLEATTRENNKITFSYDVAHTTFIVALTCRDKASANAGLTLTARGSSLLNALSALIYKDTVILKDGVWQEYMHTNKGSDLG